MFTFTQNWKEYDNPRGVINLVSKMSDITSEIRANVSTSMWDTTPEHAEKYYERLIGNLNNTQLFEDEDSPEDIIQRVKWFLDGQADHLFNHSPDVPMDVAIIAFKGICEAFGQVGLAYGFCPAWWVEIDTTPEEEYERAAENGEPCYPYYDYEGHSIFSADNYLIDGFSFPTMQEVVENLYDIMKLRPGEGLMLQ